MLLTPIFGLQLRPKLNTWFTQYRNARPNIKVGKTKFQLELDVKNFNKDEIQVKARPEFVIIEGKREQKTKRGYIMRKFVRKFKLPPGCVTQCMKSKLSNDGILTITAPRKVCEESMPCETLIPVSQTVKEQTDSSYIPVSGKSPDSKNNQPEDNKPSNESKKR